MLLRLAESPWAIKPHAILRLKFWKSGDDSMKSSASFDYLLQKIREENLNVYRASIQRLREDVGQESQIAQDYRGRLIYELLQNADDAMSSSGNGPTEILFVLDEQALWVANSGRPLDEPDVRGLCGISASSKSLDGTRRASIGHKGMGFKSVLEITRAPEVYSTSLSFRFGPTEARDAVQRLVEEGLLDTPKRAPITRFPWPIQTEPSTWMDLRARGMNTAFRFPLLPKMGEEQRLQLATSLRDLPVTSLVFLKHTGRVEIRVQTRELSFHSGWKVARERVNESGGEAVEQFSKRGTYRVTLRSDSGTSEQFLVAHEPEIDIGEHRGGLEEVSWDNVTVTELSVAARLSDGQPIPLPPEWRKFHVFLPTAEACPYDLLISGAFNSNLSRQEIRVEANALNYNRFLLQQSARVVRDTLLPLVLTGNAGARGVIAILDRRANIGEPCATAAAQVFYEQMRAALGEFPFIPSEGDKLLSPEGSVLPPLIADKYLGEAFRSVLPVDAHYDDRQFPAAAFCSSEIARVLADHGACCLSPEEAAHVLARCDPERSRLDIVGKVFVDPVLRVLERLWLSSNECERRTLSAAVKRESLFPVGEETNYTPKRIATIGLTCFYPPRSLKGEVPLKNLCFLMQEICWGDLTPKERRQELQIQMRAWEGLFDIQEFKFPEVMRASVLPALELDREAEVRQDRGALRTPERIAAICQLAGRTSNPKSPLPYERLGSNRALFNLSRLDVPCRGATPGEVQWVPAYRAYLGRDWVGEHSVETILDAAKSIGADDIPNFAFLAGYPTFAGLLEQYSELREVSNEEVLEPGEDEVSVDEDEDSAIETTVQSRWLAFFKWLGVNQSLRPVHFHDVEERSSGWTRTANLCRPEGWVFKNTPEPTWLKYVAEVRRSLEASPENVPTVPYFYRLHDIDQIVPLLQIASQDPTTTVGRALYEHLARNWQSLEGFSRVQIARVTMGKVPAMRTKPPRALPEELIECGPDFWLARLQDASFCPTTNGPRFPPQVWLPTREVERRFGRRGKTGSVLVPSLDVDAAMLKGKARGLAQVLGIRDELTPASFSHEDACLLLHRLQDLYSTSADAGQNLRLELREVIRPAYRQLLELLSSREGQGNSTQVETGPLSGEPILATDGAGHYRFMGAKDVYYVDRRDTRERIVAPEPIWTFVVEALPTARTVLPRDFRMRVLENELVWSPRPGEPALDEGGQALFHSRLNHLAPYIMARLAAERSDERLVRIDVRRLRQILVRLEPVSDLELSCQLDGQEIDLGLQSRDAFVHLENDGAPDQAFIVWSESAWPPGPAEAEALAGALCEVFGSGYFESFLALIQANTNAMRLRILRRAGAPLDIDERQAMFLDGDSAGDDQNWTDGLKTDLKTVIAPPPPLETGASLPVGANVRSDGAPPYLPLYSADQLVIEGSPVIVKGSSAQTVQKQVEHVDKGNGGNRPNPNHGSVYGGRTDLELLSDVGMAVALSFERNRLRKSDLSDAEVFDIFVAEEQNNAWVFDVSTPDRIAFARKWSPKFALAMDTLVSKFGVSQDWPGFDLLTLDPRKPDLLDRLIELKSSGVAARLQEMTWNEWKTAAGSTLRHYFYLYLVGNLRSDLEQARPYIRTINNPVEQLLAEVQINKSTTRTVQVTVNQFREAEHLELGVKPLKPLSTADSGAR